MWAAILNILLGLWLMVSPALLDLGKEAANNNYIFGPVILTFAIISLWEVNRRPVQYFNILPAAWLLVSPVFLGLSFSEILFSTWIPALLILSFSFLKINIKKSYGGGWFCLFK